MCPMTIAIGVGGVIVGFAVGRLSKGGKNKQCGCRNKQQRTAERKENARQPIAPGSVEIYVGNLSYEVTEDEIKKLFSKFGAVENARLVTNRFNGKSKGFGFVVMPNREEAEKAIAEYSEKEFMGRKMRVNEAKNTIVE